MAPNDQKKASKWFVLRADKEFGPFSQFEMTRMLTKGELFEYDYIWADHLHDWIQLSGCPEFQNNQIGKLNVGPTPGVDRLFFRRKYPRALYGTSVVIHDKMKVWKAQTFEIGAGGAGIITTTEANFDVDKELFLHFKPADGVPPFNAMCRVVSKRASSDRTSSWLYGVEFRVLNKDIKSAIFEFTNLIKKVA